LATAEFEDLLAGELASPERFRSVESKIAQGDRNCNSKVEKDEVR